MITRRLLLRARSARTAVTVAVALGVVLAYSATAAIPSG